MAKATTLGEMQPGDKGKILRVDGEGSLRRRMLELGLLPGADIRVCRRGPLWGPLFVHTRGYDLALRKQEAQLITVEVDK